MTIRPTMDGTAIFGIIFTLNIFNACAIGDFHEFFLNSQMSYCMQKGIKPTKQALPGVGGFVHCRNSIDKCIGDMLYCKTHKINNEATENISLATIDIAGFCGQIDVHWNPPVNARNLFYMARTWNISLQAGYSINITVLEFELEYSEECMLDHMRYDRLFPGSVFGMIEDDFKMWGRLCGKKANFFLYSYNNTARIAAYIESYGVLYIGYGVLISGKVKALSHTQIKQNPMNLETKEFLDGYYLKLFRENSYFWFIKGDIRALMVIKYKIDFSESPTTFYMSIIDGPPIYGSMSYQTLLEEINFNPDTESKHLSGRHRATGKM